MRKTSKIISRLTRSRRRPPWRTTPRRASRSHAAGAIYFPQEEDADIRAKFEYCKRAGIAVIVAGDPAPETLPRLEKFVKEYDIRIAIHNHGPEDKLWPSPLDVLKAVKGMDPRIGCCIDVGHTARAGTDVVRAIHEAAPRLFNLHMKDLTNFQNKESQVAVGDGIMPVRRMFEALIAVSYKGFVDLEYEVHPNDPMAGVISSLAYMRASWQAWGMQATAEARSYRRTCSAFVLQRPARIQLGAESGPTRLGGDPRTAIQDL